ncbi:MAG: hypothetical protein ABFC88_12845 [Thermoguttaceae bacterium]
MKIAGIDPKTLCNEVILVLPRGEEQKLVFKAKGLKDMDEFNVKCPLPKPPGKQTRDGWVANENDPTYQQVMDQWGKKRLGYIVINSLVPSEIEWDTVKFDDPRTWASWDKDLMNGGLTQVETNRVLGLVLEANALDEAKLAKAREVFLRGQAPLPAESSGPVTEPASSQSGVPANG